MTADINQAEVLQQVRDRGLLDLSKVELGIVKSYSSVTGLAVVSPAVLTGDDTDTEDVPILQFDVGGFRINGVVSAGTEVLMLFCDQDPSAFLTTGSASAPEHTRPHARYPIAIPLTLSAKRHTQVSAMAAFASTAVIGSLTSGGQIQFAATSIKLGGVSAFSPALRMLDLTALLNALSVWQIAVSTAIKAAGPGGPAAGITLDGVKTAFDASAAAIAGSPNVTVM